MENNIKRAHSLVIRDGVVVTGVTQVISMEEKEVKVVVRERTLTLTGNGFAAEKLSIEEGTLALTGEVREVKYAAKQEAKSLLKRLFK